MGQQQPFNSLKGLKSIFQLEKKPKKGLLLVEWVVMAYLLFTLVFALFMYTKLENPNAIIWDDCASLP